MREDVLIFPTPSSFLIFLTLVTCFLNCFATMAAPEEKQKDDAPLPAASNTSDSDVEILTGNVNEKSLLRKLDLRLLPAVSVLYLLSFLDRSNGTHMQHQNPPLPP